MSGRSVKAFIDRRDSSGNDFDLWTCQSFMLLIVEFGKVTRGQVLRLIEFHVGQVLGRRKAHPPKNERHHLSVAVHFPGGITATRPCRHGIDPCSLGDRRVRSPSRRIVSSRHADSSGPDTQTTGNDVEIYKTPHNPDDLDVFGVSQPVSNGLLIELTHESSRRKCRFPRNVFGGIRKIGAIADRRWRTNGFLNTRFDTRSTDLFHEGDALASGEPDPRSAERIKLGFMDRL